MFFGKSGVSLALLAFVFFESLSVFSAEVDNASVVFSTRSLSLESANKVAWGALAECRRLGFSVAVAVVDRGGNGS